MVDLKAYQEAYNNGLISEVEQIVSEHNVTDALYKLRPNEPTMNFMRLWHPDATINQRIERAQKLGGRESVKNTSDDDRNE